MDGCMAGRQSGSIDARYTCVICFYVSEYENMHDLLEVAVSCSFKARSLEMLDETVQQTLTHSDRIRGIRNQESRIQNKIK